MSKSSFTMVPVQSKGAKVTYYSELFCEIYERKGPFLQEHECLGLKKGS